MAVAGACATLVLVLASCGSSPGTHPAPTKGSTPSGRIPVPSGGFPRTIQWNYFVGQVLKWPGYRVTFTGQSALGAETFTAVDDGASNISGTITLSGGATPVSGQFIVTNSHCCQAHFPKRACWEHRD